MFELELLEILRDSGGPAPQSPANGQTDGQKGLAALPSEAVRKIAMLREAKRQAEMKKQKRDKQRLAPGARTTKADALRAAKERALARRKAAKAAKANNQRAQP